MTPRPVHLNGRLVPPGEACVSVLDRGFLFGDGVYEVVPVYGGRPFRLEAHLERLARSLAAVGIPNPHDRAGWTALVGELLAAGPPGEDLGLYIQVTRGAAETRDHVPPADLEPTVVVMASPIPQRPPEIAERGVAAVRLADLRWGRCDIKAVTLLANVLARREAARRGAAEAILVRDGLVTEGAASNVFAVLDGTVVTPPKGPRILPGITRDVVLELARAEGLAAREAALPAGALDRAEEIWISSSTRELVPVTHLDGRPVGEGRPGPLWRRLDAAYQALKARHRAGA